MRKAEFQNYQHMETLVNEGLRIAMNHVLVDDSLEVVLSYLGRILQADRVYIFERNAKGNDDNTYEWVRDGVTAEKENLQDLPAEVCAKWYQDFSEDKITVIKELEEIREIDPLQYENLKGQNIHTLITVPLFEDGQPIGFYGVDNPPADMLEYTANLLQMMGYFVLALLRQRNLQKKLLHYSYYDVLTGVGNRRLFADTLKSIGSDEDIGFVYCDVTGLKKVNDTEGHQAGDNLLMRTVSALIETFREGQLFRLGGDEFLVIDRSSDCDTLDQKVLQLRENALRRQVNLAIGHAWQAKPGNQLMALLAIAERAMYEDKAEYYRRTGCDRRR